MAVNSPLAPAVPVRKKLVTVSSLSAPKCAYLFCSLSIPVKECKKRVNTKCDGWLHHLCQINQACRPIAPVLDILENNVLTY